VSLRQTEDELISSMLSSTSSFVNCTNGSDGDNPTEITLADVQNIVRTLRNNSAYSFLSGISGENKFGSAPRIACGGFKPWIIDLECLAA
jgi:hypothetical protein